tara:strand:- start:596 stop:1009 length:414 start_codon:yes stop_codon:yes gene_type:complete
MVRFLKKILNKVVGEETLEDTILESTKQEVETQTTLLQKKAEPFTGVPAPVYLKDDEWFGPAPEYTEKQKDYMAQETEIKRQEFEKSFSVEPEDIHQKMYEISTKSQNTTLHLNPPGGSENFQEGGWQSGTGFGQYR